MRIYLFLLFSFVHVSAWSQTLAQDLFNQYRDALFQIQIIEKESDNKSSIGSGFAINANGLIVTNYHVISDYVYFPDKYRMQMMDAHGETTTLTLRTFDIVNDIALVEPLQTRNIERPFQLASELPEQGVAIFSLGNPHDLGMIVVPGTFNGLKQPSFYQRIHFTGSINPGMSGGPAVNESGQVIGVNVATAGNQIGFLVPLAPLLALADRGTESIAREDYKKTLHQQLLANQAALIAQFEQDNWPVQSLGRAAIPSNVVPFLSCWGNSNAEEPTAMYLSVENRCRLDEQIYVNRHLTTGALEMEFEWISSDQLGSHRFYNLLANGMEGARPGNAAAKTDITRYQCQQDLVRNKNDIRMRSVLCVRGYKDFPGLYDALYIAATLDFEQQSLISHYTLAGVNKQSIQTFTQRFMDALAWQ